MYRHHGRKRGVSMTRVTDAAQIAADRYGVDVADVIALMPDAYNQLRAERDMIEPARIRACYITRLNAKRCDLWEDAGFDYSTRPRFDCHARTVAFEHPELGLDPHNTDTPPAIWELIKRGPLPRLTKSSAEVADLAAQWASRFNVHYNEFTDWNDDDLDAIEPDADCDCSFNPDEFDNPVTGEVVTAPVSEEFPTPVSRESLTTFTPCAEIERVNACPGYRLFLWPSVILPHKRRSGRFQSVRGHSKSPPMPPVRYDPQTYLVVGSVCGVRYHSRGHPVRGNHCRPRHTAI